MVVNAWAGACFNSWQCGLCTLVNKATRSKCAACGLTVGGENTNPPCPSLTTLCFQFKIEPPLLFALCRPARTLTG